MTISPPLKRIFLSKTNVMNKKNIFKDKSRKPNFQTNRNIHFSKKKRRNPNLICLNISSASLLRCLPSSVSIIASVIFRNSSMVSSNSGKVWLLTSLSRNSKLSITLKYNKHYSELVNISKVHRILKRALIRNGGNSKVFPLHNRDF